MKYKLSGVYVFHRSQYLPSFAVSYILDAGSEMFRISGTFNYERKSQIGIISSKHLLVLQKDFCAWTLKEAKFRTKINLQWNSSSGNEEGKALFISAQHFDFIKIKHRQSFSLLDCFMMYTDQSCFSSSVENFYTSIFIVSLKRNWTLTFSWKMRKNRVRTATYKLSISNIAKHETWNTLKSNFLRLFSQWTEVELLAVILHAALVESIYALKSSSETNHVAKNVTIYTQQRKFFFCNTEELALHKFNFF